MRTLMGITKYFWMALHWIRVLQLVCQLPMSQSFNESIGLFSKQKICFFFLFLAVQLFNFGINYGSAKVWKTCPWRNSVSIRKFCTFAATWLTCLLENNFIQGWSRTLKSDLFSSGCCCCCCCCRCCCCCCCCSWSLWWLMKTRRAD